MLLSGFLCFDILLAGSSQLSVPQCVTVNTTKISHILAEILKYDYSVCWSKTPSAAVIKTTNVLKLSCPFNNKTLKGYMHICKASN